MLRGLVYHYNEGSYQCRQCSTFPVDSSHLTGENGCLGSFRVFTLSSPYMSKIESTTTILGNNELWVYFTDETRLIINHRQPPSGTSRIATFLPPPYHRGQRSASFATRSKGKPPTCSSQCVGLLYVTPSQTRGVLLHSTHQSCPPLLFIPTSSASIRRAPDPWFVHP